MLLIGICSVAAGFYIFFVVHSQVITILQPSFDLYQQSYDRYPETLLCPCSQVSIPYQTFLNVTYVLHQVCFSDFISPAWLDYAALLDPLELPFIAFTDFRASGYAYFQLLAIFCSYAKNHIEDAQHVFTNTHFINSHILTAPSFIQQTKAIVEAYINGTQANFERSIDWIKATVSTNNILTGTNTNFHIAIDANDSVTIDSAWFLQNFEIVGDSIIVSGTCSCENDPVDCLGRNFLFPTASTQLRNENYFPDLPVGCIPLTGFFASTFSWWYNETYFNEIQATYAVFLRTPSSPNITSLQTSISTRFHDETMEHLLRNMFVEAFITNNTGFKQFYSRCAPISCSYTIVQRRDIIILLLLLISICGGLNKSLQILVPSIGKFIFFFIDYWKNRDTQQSE